jgi:hypothetical protein
VQTGESATEASDADGRAHTYVRLRDVTLRLRHSDGAGGGAWMCLLCLERERDQRCDSEIYVAT